MRPNVGTILVGQPRSPRDFGEVVDDPQHGSFPRQHHADDPGRLYRELAAGGR